MPKIVETDIAIIGGGIAGLWLLNRLRNLDFAAILLESGTLGGGQTTRRKALFMAVLNIPCKVILPQLRKRLLICPLSGSNV